MGPHVQRGLGHAALHARADRHVPRRHGPRPLSRCRLDRRPLPRHGLQPARQRLGDGRRRGGPLLHFGQLLQRVVDLPQRGRPLRLRLVDQLQQVQLPRQRRREPHQDHGAQRQPGQHLREELRPGPEHGRHLGLRLRHLAQRLPEGVLRRHDLGAEPGHGLQPLEPAGPLGLPRAVLELGPVAHRHHAEPRHGDPGSERQRQVLVGRLEHPAADPHQDPAAVPRHGARRGGQPGLRGPIYAGSESLEYAHSAASSITTTSRVRSTTAASSPTRTASAPCSSTTTRSRAARSATTTR